MMTSAQRDQLIKICRRVVEEKDQRKFIELLQELQLLFVRSEKQNTFSSSHTGPDLPQNCRSVPHF
jgi:hypothetical protein